MSLTSVMVAGVMTRPVLRESATKSGLVVKVKLMFLNKSHIEPCSVCRTNFPLEESTLVILRISYSYSAVSTNACPSSTVGTESSG